MYVVSREEIIPISALSSGEKQIPCLPLQPKREELSTMPYCCQPAFTQTLWLPLPFDSKGASSPSDSFFSSPEADVRLRLLRVAYSCRVSK